MTRWYKVKGVLTYHESKVKGVLTCQSRAVLQTCSCGLVGDCRRQERSCQASRRCIGPECPPTDLGPIRQYATTQSHHQTDKRSKSFDKKRLTGAHSPVRGHPGGSKVVPLNSWGRVSY